MNSSETNKNSTENIMNYNLEKQMEKAWTYIWNTLFSDTSNLFYDYISNREHENRFDHLPYPDEIAQQFPNPCGWGTGMEDSMLNAGSVMDILRLRRELAKDQTALPLAEKLIDGMFLCSHVHGVPGFVARSVSPRDLRSCYFNSSRDQFTLCVYGAWRFLRSFPDASPVSRKQAKQILVDIASYCEKNLSPEQDNLLRLDGKPALVSDMIHVFYHEIMRLPMFYAAAWEASGDPHWFELYRNIALDGIERSLKIDMNLNWWDIALSQMQLSVHLLASVESDEQLRGKYLQFLKLGAQLAEKEFKNTITKTNAFNGDWNCLNRDWRRMKMRIRGETLEKTGSSAIYKGYPYMLPEFPEQYEVPYSILRSAGNLLYCVCLSPENTPSQDLLNTFKELAMKSDYNTHASDAPVKLLHGYWIAKSGNIF